MNDNVNTITTVGSIGLGYVGLPLAVAFAEAGLRVGWLPWKDAEPYPVPTLGGGFMAMRHDTLKCAGSFDVGMSQWGSEDLEHWHLTNRPRRKKHPGQGV